MKLYEAYTNGDADLVEINPLIVTPEGRVHVLDAKVTLDGNAGFRHDLAPFDATQPRDEREAAAHAKGLQYVGLEGSVGVIANGAGSGHEHGGRGESGGRQTGQLSWTSAEAPMPT